MFPFFLDLETNKIEGAGHRGNLYVIPIFLFQKISFLSLAEYLPVIYLHDVEPRQRLLGKFPYFFLGVP